MKELSKIQMLRRLQFSNNLQTAIKANELLTGTLSEDKIMGGFLTAVLKNDYPDAVKRADSDNLKALNAIDFTVEKFMFIRQDYYGYKSGESYWLKLKTINGILEVTPPVNCEGDALKYPNFKEFLYEWGLPKHRL